MPLFEAKPIDENEVKELVKEHWALDLGKCLKAFQNHVFLALRQDDTKFIVRVTPDIDGTRKNDTEVELALLDYLHANNLPVCKSVPTQTKQPWVIAKSSPMIICVFEYAKGDPVVLTEWKWMTEKDQVVGLGRWFSKLHPLTQRFAKEHPDLYAKARNYTELHDGVLKDVPIQKEDQDAMQDPLKFGLIHGDVNLSNFFWDASIQMTQMFDWDQAQRAWFLYDLSAPIWTVITMRNGGNPIDKTPVPEANVQQYTEWLVSGFEEGV